VRTSHCRARAATSACAAPGASSWTGVTAAAAGEQHDVVAFKAGEVCGEELTPGDDDDVEAGSRLVAAEQFAGKALGPVADNGSPEFARGGHAEPRSAGVREHRFASQDEHGHEAAVPLRAVLVDVLEVGPPADALVRLESLGHAGFLRHRRLARRDAYETVRRLRPLARRRFRTRRPFLVLMRSRKPCVLRRRLRLG